MGKIHGIDVVLYEKTQTGTDALNCPIFSEAAVTVPNVIVSPAESSDLPDTLDLTGKKAVYTLGIPKGDTHVWEDRKVEFFGQAWKTFGFIQEGIEDLVPLEWNKKISVERYE